MTLSTIPNLPKLITRPDLFDEAGTLQPMPAAFFGGIDFLAGIIRRHEVF